MADDRRAPRPSTRKVAIAAGAVTYIPEKPCVRCGSYLRYTSTGTCLECQRTPEKRAAAVRRTKAWVQALPEDERKRFNNARAKKWRVNNPESASRADKRSYERRDKDKHSAYMKLWREENRLHVSAYGNAYKKQWRKDNPEAARMKGRLARQRRRALELNAEGTFSEQDIIDLMIAQDGVCATCPADISEKYEIDHKTSLKRGGTHWPHNLQLLCENCNSQKWQRSDDEWCEILARRASGTLNVSV